jgi:hypothetical protein
MNIEKSVKKKRDNTVRVVKNPIVTDLSQFLEYIFNTEEQVNCAEIIINAVPFRDSDWVSLTAKNNISGGLYSKTLTIMKNVGLLEKVDREIRFSKRFCSSLRKLSEYWSDYVDSKKEKEN